jgi:hypothetical protein
MGGFVGRCIVQIYIQRRRLKSLSLKQAYPANICGANSILACEFTSQYGIENCISFGG